MALRVLIGADPEMAIRDIKTGEFVSAHTLLPGTKLDPFQVDFGAIQVDGVAAEFNIDPASSATHFTSFIKAVTENLKNRIGPNYELVSQPSVVFPEEYFKTLPENVRELGCNPDFNAWTGEVNERPDGDKTTMRTFAGHVHIGWGKGMDPTDDTHFDDCRIIAKNLDYYLGLFSLQWDQDTSRRKLYGKAGAFRPKPYGMEYRPLSNVWLRTPELQTWVFNAAFKGAKDVIQGGIRLDETLGDIAREFIDNSESWWKPEDTTKSKDHKRLSSLSNVTGLKNPPPLPVIKPPGTPSKVADKASPKHIYGTITEAKKSGAKLEKLYWEPIVKGWAEEN